jgi:hypothetical protein
MTQRIIACCLAAIVLGPSTIADSGCSIQILSPSVRTGKADASANSGPVVEGEGDAHGTASLPAGQDLWALTRKKGLANWLLQSSGPVPVMAGGWSVHIRYGGPNEGGRYFELLLIVVDEKTSAQLGDWARKHKDEGMPLPPIVRCQQKLLVFRRP